MRKQIADLEEVLQERTKEANHLMELVEKMEASGNQSDMIKVQMQDLKTELNTAEGKTYLLEREANIILLHWVPFRDRVAQIVLFFVYNYQLDILQ